MSGGDRPAVSTGVVPLGPPAPALAQGVELLGPYRGSGSREAPCLLRRHGRTLEVSPLLYLVCTTIDGRRDLDEIAALVGAAYGRAATADDVSWLLERKLAPLGVLAGTGPGAAGAGAVPPPTRPVLGLSARAAVIPATAVHRLTRPLTFLFRPPVLAIVLVAWAAVDAWLLASQGLARGVGHTAGSPSLLLAVAALTVAAGAFHEFGHAAACRYGGATPGPIGAGIYLVWPVFYNDLDDSYRLDRPGRLRADLGGVYFNGVFIVVLGLAYLATGFQPLVVAVAVQHLAILQQFLPFVRLDGYYVVSDVAGVPDLFSRIRPILSSLVPGRAPSPAVTGLTRPARAVVTAWVLVTVPVLIGLLVALVVRLPDMAATVWRSAHGEVLSFAAAWGDGALGAMALDCLQLGLLAVPPAGILLTVAFGVWSRLAGR